MGNVIKLRDNTNVILPKSLVASPCPPKERVLKKSEAKVLSFGEDLGEAQMSRVCLT
jgi:hypothetical protein